MRKFLVLFAFCILMSVLIFASGSKENYVAKTDFQYMKPDWDKSWHTITTDTAFEPNETFYLNIDIAISAKLVKKEEISASISFAPPRVFQDSRRPEVVDGPVGTWRKDNIGTYSYSFKIPVSKSAVKKDSTEPVYTNPVHLQFRIIPDTVGEQLIRVNFDDSIISAYSREFVIV